MSLPTLFYRVTRAKMYSYSEKRSVNQLTSCKRRRKALDEETPKKEKKRRRMKVILNADGNDSECKTCNISMQVILSKKREEERRKRSH